MSEREWGRKGKETMGFATPNGLLPLRALAGTAKKRKLEAEASESQLHYIGVCRTVDLKPRHRDANILKLF